MPIQKALKRNTSTISTSSTGSLSQKGEKLDDFLRNRSLSTAEKERLKQIIINGFVQHCLTAGLDVGDITLDFIQKNIVINYDAFYTKQKSGVIFYRTSAMEALKKEKKNDNGVYERPFDNIDILDNALDNFINGQITETSLDNLKNNEKRIQKHPQLIYDEKMLETELYEDADTENTNLDILFNPQELKEEIVKNNIQLIDKKNSQGNSPLHQATLALNENAVNILLMHGAKMQPNRAGKRSIQLANDQIKKNKCNPAVIEKANNIINALTIAAKLNRAEERLLSQAKTSRYQFHHYSKLFREISIASPRFFAAYLTRQLGENSSFPASLKEKAQRKLKNLSCVACCDDVAVQRLIMPADAKDQQLKFLNQLKNTVNDWKPNRSIFHFFKKSLPEAIDNLKKIIDPHLENLTPEQTNRLFEQTKLVLKTHQSGRFIPAFFSRSGAFCRNQYQEAVELLKRRCMHDLSRRVT